MTNIKTVQAIRSANGNLSRYDGGEVVTAYEWDGTLWPSLETVEAAKEEKDALGIIESVLIDSAHRFHFDIDDLNQYCHSDYEREKRIVSKVVEAIVLGLTSEYDAKSHERSRDLRTALNRQAVAAAKR